MILIHARACVNISKFSVSNVFISLGLTSDGLEIQLQVLYIIATITIHNFQYLLPFLVGQPPESHATDTGATSHSVGLSFSQWRRPHRVSVLKSSFGWIMEPHLYESSVGGAVRTHENLWQH